MAKKDPTKPDLTLLIKIVSAVVHAQELVETNFKNADFNERAYQAGYSAGLSEREKLEAVVEAAKKYIPLSGLPESDARGFYAFRELQDALAGVEAGKEEGK